MKEMHVVEGGSSYEKKFREFVSGLTLATDVVFPKILRYEEVALPIVEELVGKNVTRLSQIREQDKTTVPGADGNFFSVIYDASLEADGTPMDIELQKTVDDRGPMSRRVRISSAFLDSRYCSRTGKDKYRIPDSYVVFFTKGDHLRQMSSAIMEFTRTCHGEPLNDGSHIIVVDYTRWTELTFLPNVQTFCAMLNGEKVDSDYASVIQNYLDDLVHDKEVMQSMFSFEDKLEERYYNGLAEGEKKAINEAIRGMHTQGMPMNDIAKSCDMLFPSVGKGFAFWKPFIEKVLQ